MCAKTHTHGGKKTNVFIVMLKPFASSSWTRITSLFGYHCFNGGLVPLNGRRPSKCAHQMKKKKKEKKNHGYKLTPIRRSLAMSFKFFCVLCATTEKTRLKFPAGLGFGENDITIFRHGPDFKANLETCSIMTLDHCWQ